MALIQDFDGGLELKSPTNIQSKGPGAVIGAKVIINNSRREEPTAASDPDAVVYPQPADKNDIVFIPIGCTENHGLHLPSATDTLFVSQILEGDVLQADAPFDWGHLAGIGIVQNIGHRVEQF